MIEVKDHEKYVGIEEYSTDTEPVGGSLKKSIADFIVREIQTNGRVLSTFDNDTNQPYFDSKKHK